MLQKTAVESRSSSSIPTSDGQVDTLVVTSRSATGSEALLKLSDGTRVRSRRFLPVGENDLVRVNGESISVLAKKDNVWVEVGAAWKRERVLSDGDLNLPISFKEIETPDELRLFQQLKEFHYLPRVRTKAPAITRV